MSPSKSDLGSDLPAFGCQGWRESAGGCTTSLFPDRLDWGPAALKSQPSAVSTVRISDKENLPKSDKSHEELYKKGQIFVNRILQPSSHPEDNISLHLFTL